MHQVLCQKLLNFEWMFRACLVNLEEWLSLSEHTFSHWYGIMLHVFIVCPVGQDYFIGDNAFKGENGKFDPLLSQNAWSDWHEILLTWLRTDVQRMSMCAKFGKDPTRGRYPPRGVTLPSKKFPIFFFFPVFFLRQAHRSHRLTHANAQYIKTRVLTQGSAFRGSRWWILKFGVVGAEKPPKFGPRWRNPIVN